MGEIKTIAIGCDHGGYDRKQEVMAYLTGKGYAVTDFGCFSKDSMDYPDVAFPTAEAVAAGKFDRGIVICTTGIGVSICANKVKGIRCALVADTFSAEMTRRHNDTNILALSAHCTDYDTSIRIIDIWLDTAFEGGKPEGARHLRRVEKITAYENQH